MPWEHIPFGLAAGSRPAATRRVLGPAAGSPGVRDPPELPSKRGLISGLEVSVLRLGFPHNRGASSGRLEAGAVELTQFKDSFNPFT